MCLNNEKKSFVKWLLYVQLPGGLKVLHLCGLKVLHLWHHSQKTHTPKQKNYFRVWTRRLAASFKNFTGSV